MAASYNHLGNLPNTDDFISGDGGAALDGSQGGVGAFNNPQVILMYTASRLRALNWVICEVLSQPYHLQV